MKQISPTMRAVLQFCNYLSLVGGFWCKKRGIQTVWGCLNWLGDWAVQCVSLDVELQTVLRAFVPFVPWYHLGLIFQWVFQSSLSTVSSNPSQDHLSSLRSVPEHSSPRWMDQAFACPEPLWLKTAASQTVSLICLCTYSRYLAGPSGLAYLLLLAWWCWSIWCDSLHVNLKVAVDLFWGVFLFLWLLDC